MQSKRHKAVSRTLSSYELLFPYIGWAILGGSVTWGFISQREDIEEEHKRRSQGHTIGYINTEQSKKRDWKLPTRCLFVCLFVYNGHLLNT